MKKINFYIMSYKGFRALEKVIENNICLINSVCIGRDLNVRKDYFEEIKTLCEDNNLSFFLSNEAHKITKADYSIAISWKWMIKNNENLIVFHDSLLPKYRGFAPLVSQLINGEEYLGVTAIFANDYYDQGDIIVQRSQKIFYPIKIKRAIEIVSICYTDCLEFILNSIKIKNKLQSKSQDHSKASYSLWRDEEDYKINWYESSTFVKRFVDSVGFPYKGAKTFLNNKEIFIEDVELFEDVYIKNRDVGKVIFIIDEKPVVVCLKGLIIIKKAFYVDTNNSILPFTKIRSRFMS